MEALAVTIGIAGAALVLLSYGLLSTGRLTADDARYQWLNIIGTLAILGSLMVQWNLPSFILNGAWVLIGIAGLIRIHCKGAR
jgi:hypothetical protein